MEKILLAMDAVKLPMPAIDFACFIGRLTNSKITGVFLENLVAEEKPVLAKELSTQYPDWEIDAAAARHQDKLQLIEKNISLFREACENRSVRCSIHRDRDTPAEEIINESRFADLIITDASSSFHKKYEGMPTGFVKDMLQEAECPVIIAPEWFNGIDEVIFTYDGSKSAAFAMKQFTYLFPELNNRKVTVLQVNKEGRWTDKDKYNLREWLLNRYSTIGFEALKGDAEDRLFDYMLTKKKAFIVLGAYGRNTLSRFFKHSHADHLIKTIAPPIFIAHY